jgi:hypothetical protein
MASIVDRPESPAKGLAQKHCEAQKRYYEQNAAIINRKRFYKRVANGTIKKMLLSALKRYNMTPEQFNQIREGNNLPPLPHPHDVPWEALCTAPLGGSCPPSTQERPECPARGTAQGDTAQGSASIEDSVEGGRKPPAPGLGRIMALEGKPQLDKDGRPNGKTISKGTAKQYAESYERFLAPLVFLASKGTPLGAQSIINLSEENYSSVNTRKSKLNAIVALAKYIPEIREALGVDIEPLREKMIEYIKESERAAVKKSGTHTVEDLNSIRRRVENDVKVKYGEMSQEYVAGVLQTRLVGLRGELGTVRVFKTNRNGQFDNAKNAYNRKTGELKIEDFKTKQNFDAYDFFLKGGPYELLERWFKEHPRHTYLFGNSPIPIGPILKRSLGISVMPIRHSMVSNELKKGNPSRDHIEKVAKLFRHSPEMTTMYFRGSPPEEDL